MNITILKRTAHHSYGEVVVDDIVGDLVAVPVKDNTYYDTQSSHLSNTIDNCWQTK